MGEHMLNMSQYDSGFSRQSPKEERRSRTTLGGKVLPASLTIRKNSCTLNTSSEETVTWSFNQNALDLRPTELFSATDRSLGFKPLCVSTSHSLSLSGTLLLSTPISSAWHRKTFWGREGKACSHNFYYTPLSLLLLVVNLLCAQHINWALLQVCICKEATESKVLDYRCFQASVVTHRKSHLCPQCPPFHFLSPHKNDPERWTSDL